MSEQARSRTLERYVGTLETGEARGHLNLTLVPLLGTSRGGVEYLLAAEAIEAGVLRVTEVDDDGSVPELLAVNTGETLILLLDGEELVGAKQNRILNTSVLLRPESKTKIPVSCVEQGRWRHVSREFGSGSVSPSGLRARKSRDVRANLRRTGRADSDQGAVWEEVDSCLMAMDVAAPTAAMRDAVEQRKDSLDAFVDALPYVEGTRGVVAAVNGRLAAADVLDEPPTMERVWPRLVAGYALDALARGKANGATFSASAGHKLFERVGRLACDVCPSAGTGKDWRFESEDVVGQALVARRVCVHLSVFPNHGGREEEQREPRILPPSRRSRSHRTARPSDGAIE
jgi:ARG/rhodanese/phosphatase superfamily protein